MSGRYKPSVAQLDDVAHALALGHEIRTGGRGILEAVLADADIAAHAAGEVDQHVNLALADAL